MLRPGGTAIVVGVAPRGVEVSIRAIDFLSEKTIRGSYHGSADMHDFLPGLIALLHAGRLDIVDVISELIELDDVHEAIERLRRGEGARSVAIVDAAVGGRSRRAHLGPTEILAGSPTRRTTEERDEHRHRPRRTHRRGLGRRRSQRQPRQRGARPPWHADRRGAAWHPHAPSPGHAPILVVVGEKEAEYEPVWPPTVMINKATAVEDLHQTITWGAAQLGIAQGVLDAVADGLLPPTDDVVVFVAVWVDARASEETAVREANRAAMRQAIGVAVQGRDPEAARALVARRETLRSPFYSGA